MAPPSEWPTYERQIVINANELKQVSTYSNNSRSTLCTDQSLDLSQYGGGGGTVGIPEPIMDHGITRNSGEKGRAGLRLVDPYVDEER